MVASFLRRKGVAVDRGASMFSFIVLLLAAVLLTPAAVTVPGLLYTYDPCATSLSVTSGDSASFDLTIGLPFDPEPGWWVKTGVEAVDPGPFIFTFDPQTFILNETVQWQVVHVTITAPEGTELGVHTCHIKAKSICSSGSPGVASGAGCEVTITVSEAPNPTPTPTPPPGGRCFIATAAYGTPLSEEIQVLRQFRDEYLLTNPLGRLFVSLYYEGGPPVAEFIDDHPALKPMVRVGLLPAVAFSSMAVNTTLIQKMAIVGGLVLLLAALAVGLTRWARGVKI